MHYQKLMGIISICRKAGKLVMGFDPMLEALTGGKAAGVLTAADISPKTYKEVCFHCQKKGITVCSVPVTQEELAMILCRRAAVITILDKGFFNRMQELCEEAQDRPAAAE